jgi:multicomponent Na+:H+ antiporter subunit D
MNEIILPLFIVVPLIAAALCLPLNYVNKRLPFLIAHVVTLFLLCISIAVIFMKPAESYMIYRIGSLPAPYGISLIFDGLSILFITIINFAAFMICIYSASYMEKYSGKEKYFALLLLMLAGLNGVVLTGDLLNMFLFIELASIASACLVGFGTGGEETEAALKYFIMGMVASMFIMLAIVLIFSLTGSTNLAEISVQLPCCNIAMRSFVIMLLMFGFLTKAAAAPFHAWLPDAHPVAPAPISAMLSGVLIKVLGIYTLIRIIFNVVGMSFSISHTLVFFGGLSIIVGSLLAIGQIDLKRLLACSSIAQIGYIILGVGLATPMGVMGGLFHLLNHSLIKPLLFLNAGSIEHSCHTRDLNKLGGLGQKMPVTGMTSMIATFALSGIPPFNGFWSKLFVIIACVQAGSIFAAFVAVAGSIYTLYYMLKVQRLAFFGDLPTELANIKKTPYTMGFSMVILAVLCFLFGVFFQHAISLLINPAVTAVSNGLAYGKVVLEVL